MKIYKFNESVDNWTNDKLRIFTEDHEYLKYILQKYLNLRLKNEDNEIYDFYFNSEKAKKFGEIRFRYNDGSGRIDEIIINHDTIDFINSKNKKWTINELNEHCEEFDYLISIFENYLRFKINDYPDDNFCGEIDFFFQYNNYINREFVINYVDDDSDQNSYYVDDFDEMIEFLNNPGLFLNSKKYNL